MKFDLTAEPWIFVTDAQTGLVREVGIRDALLRAHEWGELQCASPLETVALLRALLAILHRACQPEDLEEWGELWRAKHFPADRINAYLDKFADRFDLFGAERPFMQVGKMQRKAPGIMARLAIEVAGGNNATLFNHSHDASPESLTPAQAARRLVAAQSFSSSLGRECKDVSVDGIHLPRPALASTICLRGTTLFLSGDTLFETLMLNLVSDVPPEEDVPYWEIDEPLSVLDSVEDNKKSGKGKPERTTRVARGFVERYAWPSRMVLLLPNKDGLVDGVYLAQGRGPDNTEGDPMKAYTLDAKFGLSKVRLDSRKAAWRDLHSYVGWKDAKKSLILRHAADLLGDDVISSETSCRLNVVGIATGIVKGLRIKPKEDKYLLWRHDRMSIPVSLLVEDALVDKIATALEDAEFVARDLQGRMGKVIQNYFKTPKANADLTPPKKDAPNIGGDKSKEQNKSADDLLSSLDPCRTYWPRLEAPFANFLIHLNKTPDDALKKWRKVVEAEALRSLQTSYSQLGHSSRALRAIALVDDYPFNANKAQVEARRRLAINAKNAKKKKGEGE